MEKNGYDKFLTGFLTILVIAVIATAAYLCYKYYQKYKLNADANNFIEDEFDNNTTDDDLYTNEEEQNAVKEQNGNGGTRGINTNSRKYKGYNVAGKIEMPTVRLQYPVLGEKINGTWQTTNANALEVSVTIQYGVGLNNVGNTVIMGHNYRSGLFFGSNKKMQIGDTIYITDWETQTRLPYKIYNKFTANEADTSFYQRDTGGKREVTLVTCESNNKYRLVIFAREA